MCTHEQLYYYNIKTGTRGLCFSFVSLQGDLVYVNYGRTEDFSQLQREMGINVTGKIVIVRYGKIFRGNKVRKVFSW